VFETCRALATEGTFAVDEPESLWEGFGLAAGTDGRLHSVFGPVESIVCVPFYAVASVFVQRFSDGFEPNPSHYVGDGLRDFALDRPRISGPRGPHILRGIVTLMMGSLAGALGVFFFHRLSLRFASRAGALVAAAGLGVASLQWPYAGTFLSEPLATAWVLASVVVLFRSPLAGGALLGLSVATHVSAILFAPFFAVVVAAEAADRRGALRAVAVFAAGLVAVGSLYALLNWMRFGDPLETGRWVDAARAERFGYGVWTDPSTGLWALLASPGKGLFWYCPAVVIAAFGAPRLIRRHRAFAFAIFAAVLFRWLFVSSRSDWHGGFSLGPRLMFMAVPFLMLPLAGLYDRLRSRGRAAVVGGLGVCAALETYFVVKEPFSAFHYGKLVLAQRGVDPFAGGRLYLQFEPGPPGSLHLVNDAPWSLGDLPTGVQLAIAGSMALAILAGAAWRARRVGAQPAA